MIKTSKTSRRRGFTLPQQHGRARGFTLLELIIVIAILAVLSVAVIIVINPAETLRTGRDSTRLSDIAAVKSALGFYLLEAPAPDLSGTAATCVNDGAGAGVETAWVSAPTGVLDANDISCNDTAPNAVAAANSGLINGSGWIPADLSAIPTPPGSPLSNFPIDPTNAKNGATAADDTVGTDNLDLFYTYGCNDGNLQFELMANMESGRYRNTGTQDKESTDGGNNADALEIGSSLTLCVDY